MSSCLVRTSHTVLKEMEKEYAWEGGREPKKKRMKWKKETGQVNRLECVQVEMERTKTDGEKSQEYRCGKKSHLSLS